MPINLLALTVLLAGHRAVREAARPTAEVHRGGHARPGVLWASTVVTLMNDDARPRTQLKHIVVDTPAVYCGLRS